MATNDVYILSLRATQNAQQIVNTFALKYLGATDPTNAEFQTVASDIKNLLRNSQVDDLSYVDWVAQKVYGTGVTYNTTPPFRVSTISYTGAFTGTLTGVQTGTPGDMQSAVVFSLNTALAGRRYKGRFFYGGLTASMVDTDGTILNANRTALQTSPADALITLIGPSGTNGVFQLGVWSDRIATNTVLNNVWPRQRVTAGTPDPANAWTAVTSITVRDYVGSQRDRRPGI